MFKKTLSGKGVKPGALLMFTSSAFPEAFTFVLGVVLEKPSVHMLMAVSLLEDELRYDVTEGLPHILSEQQLFQDLLSKAGRVTDIHVDAWACQAFLREELGQQLYSVPTEQLCSFVLSETAPPKTKHEPVQLPYGLKMPARKRNSGRQKRKPKLAARKPASSRKAKPFSAGDVIDLDTDDAESDSATAASDCDEASEESGPEAADERVALSSTAAAVEASLPQLEDELNREDEMRAAAAQAIKKNLPAPGRSTFFAKELGLFEGAIAASGRAVCWNCKLPILKGTVRFSWHHSIYRPPAWVHSACICELVQKTGLREIALRRLSEIGSSGQASSSSHCPAVPPEVSSMASQIHTALLEH